VVNAGGTLTKVSPWGKRRLAYQIQHFREASYFLLHFDIAPSAIREIERGLLISEEILRHLVTVLEDRGPALSDEELAPAAMALDELGEPAFGSAAETDEELDEVEADEVMLADEVGDDDVAAAESVEA
jgi:small subunit ribosomal protein S6